jgi:hypothetical protein
MTGKPRVEMKDSARKKSMSVFQDVYGINKEDPEQYFKHMSAVANYKNIKLQKNTKWGSVLDRTDMGTRFFAGVMSNISFAALHQSFTLLNVRTVIAPNFPTDTLDHCLVKRNDAHGFTF